MFAVQFHNPLQFPALPNPAAGIVRRAEDCRVDMLLHDFSLHILKIHTPNAGLVLHQGRVDNVIAIIGQANGKADVGRRVNQNAVSFGAKYIQSRDYSAKNAVFIGDVLTGQTGHPIPLFMPADNGIIILVPRLEIAEMRLLHPGNHGLLNGGQNRKIHVCYPHGDGVKALLGGIGRHIRHLAKGINRQGVFIPAV